jgi:N-acetylglutamate synthase-like GNAT family acetyltransferase
MSVSIERLQVADADEVRRLLVENNLPVQGLSDHWRSALVAREGGRVVGSAALELYGDAALLRSVAVAKDRQQHHIGRDLTIAALDLARISGACTVYLLTTTAEQFFPKFGFQCIGREEVPPSVQASVEFTSACPASATVMRKQL